jgi:hypothetical protein
LIFETVQMIDKIIVLVAVTTPTLIVKVKVR